MQAKMAKERKSRASMDISAMLTPLSDILTPLH